MRITKRRAGHVRGGNLPVLDTITATGAVCHWRNSSASRGLRPQVLGLLGYVQAGMVYWWQVPARIEAVQDTIHQAMFGGAGARSTAAGKSARAKRGGDQTCAAKSVDA